MIKSFLYKIRACKSSPSIMAFRCKTEGLAEPERSPKFRDTGYTMGWAEFNECKRVTRLQEPYLQGRLAKPELIDLKLHLKECTACSKKIASIEELLHILFYLQQPVAPDPQLRASILRKINQ